MEPAESLAVLGQRANGLYWTSERSVNQIADQMDLSKGMLYGLIRPLPAGLPCPHCSTELTFANRTARERGLQSCSACGYEGTGQDARDRWETTAATAGGPALVVTPARPAAHAAAGLEREARPRRDPLRLVAGLCLVAAGVLIFRGLARR